MKLSKPKVTDALKKTSANITMAARALNVNRSHLHDFINRYPDLKQLVEDEREALVDIAETALKAAVTKQEAWAVCFTLKTVGRKRGYSERIEHDVIVRPDIEPSHLNYRDAIKKVIPRELEIAKPETT